MLDPNYVRQNQEKVKKACIDKNSDPKVVDRYLRVDKMRRDLIGQVEKLRQERNQLTRDQVEKGRKIKDKLRQLEPDLKAVSDECQDLLYQIPNIVADDVPVGKNETGNVVLRKWGKPKKFDFQPRDHVELGEILDVIDIKTAAKVSGPRFGYLKGEAVLLEFALVDYAFKILSDKKILSSLANKVGKNYHSNPFVPVVPPVMIKPEVFTKMARLGLDDKDERYYFPADNLYLVGSAEHTLGSMHMEKTIPEKDFPLRYVGFSSSFRREAGSYGKDTRGILRVHQFDKIEMESFTLPEDSEKEQKFIVSIQEYLMQSLEIPYQVVMNCTGDMGDPDYRQMDIEAWLPGQNKYRETHTSDLMLDYQSRRLNTKVKRGNGKTELVHMNDATAFAIGRTIIAILENYQQKDGSVLIPKILQPYVGKEVILRKE